MPHRLRRLGSASAAVTAGALVLLLPAPAADAAAAETCKKGTDPASTIENWTCNLGNLREALLPTSPSPKPEPTPPKAPEKPAKPAPGSGNKGAEPPEKAPGKAPSAPGGEVSFGPSGSREFTPYAGGPPPESSLPPGTLPAPELATAPNGHGTDAQPQTRLVSPVAASGNDSGQMLWVAAAAGAAGAVAALNLNVAARALRRRT
ncbi:hypothetical protein E1287_14075 [Actinomadura sp. KC06]|uniref:hypothetical protein n=1 Tax=Actinomadura sp. KC06 TaxID=2530369 RepID=UPI0010503E08|nr:hypothetical protein [Actinomadura sp. KC06]TDD35403.1 hypothetical protein E1287_14075 [Actinomadura sp. KC06]